MDRRGTGPVEQHVASRARSGTGGPEQPRADDPRAAEFGRRLFFDPRVSANGQVSCATCHVPERACQHGIPLGRGVGVTNRRTMPIAGMAHSPFLFWDGRKDSLWAQAVGPDCGALPVRKFHNTGVPARQGLPSDTGRLAAADAVLRDEFNCRSRWTDSRSKCADLEFLVTGDHVLERAFKVPSLRNVAERRRTCMPGTTRTSLRV